MKYMTEEGEVLEMPDLDAIEYSIERIRYANKRLTNARTDNDESQLLMSLKQRHTTWVAEELVILSKILVDETGNTICELINKNNQ